MSDSPLKQWIDKDFYQTGAFLTSVDGETIVLGKGGEVQNATKFKSPEKPTFYLKDFYTNNYLCYSPATFLECTREEFEEFLADVKIEKAEFSAVSNDDDLYQKDFKTLSSAFKLGIQKAVLISRESFPDFQGESTVKRLLKKSFEFGAGIPYGLWNSHYGMMGSTPEVLFELDFDEVKTFALAGTAKAGEEEKLLDSEKDRHEHNLVILDIKEKLEKFSDEVEIGETDIEKFKNIIHLKTDLSAIVEEDINLTTLTNTLSPTAALGGYPTKEALGFLQETAYFQKYPERYFGSAFGLVSEDMNQFVVAIRNIQWNKNELFVESGGGVVSESDYKNELEEIHLKRMTIKKHYL